MYYDKEFDNVIEKHLIDYVIALELKNIANELHQSNVDILNSRPTHMTLGSNGATIHYGTEELKGEN